MPLDIDAKCKVDAYCKRDLPDDNWYQEQFDFIEDDALRIRIIEEYKGVRYAYKIYEGLEATDENLIFEVRHQILSYASIYEAVIHYVLYTYYADTPEFHDLQYHQAPAKIDIPRSQYMKLKQHLSHDGSDLLIYRLQERKKDESQIRFDDKCRTAESLGLIHRISDYNGHEVDMASDIIEIYGYRNAIHLIAEQRKKVQYELDLSKRAYRRMKPFISQVKDRLQIDGKSIYSLSNAPDSVANPS